MGQTDGDGALAGVLIFGTGIIKSFQNKTPWSFRPMGFLRSSFSR